MRLLLLLLLLLLRSWSDLARSVRHIALLVMCLMILVPHFSWARSARGKGEDSQVSELDLEHHE